MLTNSLAMLFLNDLDNIIAALYHAVSGISLDLEELAAHSRRDHTFSIGFVVPYLIWVIVYSLSFLHINPITNTPYFIN